MSINTSNIRSQDPPRNSLDGSNDNQAPEKKEDTTTTTKRTSDGHRKGNVVQRLKERFIQATLSKSARAQRKDKLPFMALEKQLDKAISALKRKRTSNARQALMNVAQTLEPLVDGLVDRSRKIQKLCAAHLVDALPKLSKNALDALAKALDHFENSSSNDVNLVIGQLKSSVKEAQRAPAKEAQRSAAEKAHQPTAEETKRAAALALVNQERPAIRLLQQSDLKELKDAVDLLSSKPEKGDPLPAYLAFLSKQIQAAESKWPKASTGAEPAQHKKPQAAPQKTTSTIDAKRLSPAVLKAAKTCWKYIDSDPITLSALSQTLRTASPMLFQAQTSDDLRMLKKICEEAMQATAKLEVDFQAEVDAEIAVTRLRGARRDPKKDPAVARANLVTAQQTVAMAKTMAKEIEAALDFSLKAELLSRNVDALKQEGVWVWQQLPMNEWPMEDMLDLRQSAEDLLKKVEGLSPDDPLPGTHFTLRALEAIEGETAESHMMLRKTLSGAAELVKGTRPGEVEKLPVDALQNLKHALDLLEIFPHQSHPPGAHRNALTAAIATRHKSDVQGGFEAALRAAIQETDASEVADKLLRSVVKAQEAERAFAQLSGVFDPKALSASINKVIANELARDVTRLTALRAFLNQGEGKAIRDLLAANKIDRLAACQAYLDTLSKALDAALPVTPIALVQPQSNRGTALTFDANVAMLRHLHVEETMEAPGKLIDRSSEVGVTRRDLKKAYENGLGVTDLDRAWDLLGQLLLIFSVSEDLEELGVLKELISFLLEGIEALQVGSDQTVAQEKVRKDAMSLLQLVDVAEKEIKAAIQTETTERQKAKVGPHTITSLVEALGPEDDVAEVSGSAVNIQTENAQEATLVRLTEMLNQIARDLPETLSVRALMTMKSRVEAVLRAVSEYEKKAEADAEVKRAVVGSKEATHGDRKAVAHAHADALEATLIAADAQDLIGQIDAKLTEVQKRQ